MRTDTQATWENAAPTFTVNGKFIDLDAVKDLWEKYQQTSEHIGFLRAQAHAADQHIQKARQQTDDENVKAHLDRVHVRVFEIHTGTGDA